MPASVAPKLDWFEVAFLEKVPVNLLVEVRRKLLCNARLKTGPFSTWSIRP